jgi:hypothetical protein
LQYNFYDHFKVFLLDHGLTIAALVPSELEPSKSNLYTWSLPELISIALKDRSAREAAAYEEAERLGLDMPAIDMTTPEERKVVRRLIKKLKFCKDILVATYKNKMVDSARALSRPQSSSSLASNNARSAVHA